MNLPMTHRLLLPLAAAALSVLFQHTAAAQEPGDSLVVLISSKSAQVVDIEGAAYRKVIGPARFFHNNTYLLCDTAFWNVDSRFIDAVGNVRLMQEETVLSSDRLTYLIDDNLAQFRGTLVQLTDKDDNTLRTRDLDYNTKDSLATFSNGGAMRDKDGQIIESISGSYDSRRKLFTFRDEVNMFSDTVFVKTSELDYDSETSFATFGRGTDLWNKENMLSADAGWYDRSRETFLFNRNVHIMTDSQEVWCDSVYYYRAVNDVTMLGNVQIVDTTRNISAVAGRAEYRDSLALLKMRRNPAVMAKSENAEGVADTVYVAADFIDYFTLMRFKIDSLTVVQARDRLKGLETDAIGTYRRKAAEEAAKKADQAAMENDANYAAKKAAEGKRTKPPGGADGRPARETAGKAPAEGKTAGGDIPGAISKGERGKDGEAAGNTPAAIGKAPDGIGKEGLQLAGMPELTEGKAATDSVTTARGAVRDTAKTTGHLAAAADTVSVADSAALVRDSLANVSGNVQAASDSLANAGGADVRDSVAAAVRNDSTKIGFLSAQKNVRLYRRDASMVCDSLLYSDIDSLARLYVKPAVWQEKTRQYAADSIYIVIRNNAMDRASLMSEAFITIQEDSLHYDQIKSAEMMAYFDGEGSLSRFDALGGAQALFFIRENDALATVNKTDSKMLSASFKDGSIQRIYYYDTAKSDGYPVVQLGEEEKQLKGFNWQPERRPADRRAVTDAEYRAPERKLYLAHPQAAFRQTNLYFPGYMDGIYSEMEFRDSMRLIREAEASFRKSQLELEKAKADTLAKDAPARPDSLHPGDSLALKEKTAGDVKALKDSLSAISDSLSAAPDSLRAKSGSVALTAADSVALTAADSTALDPKAAKAAQKAAQKAAREEKAAQRKAEREARWQAKEDARKAKQEAKERRKLEKLRAKKRKAMKEELEELRRENEVYEKYRQKYEQKKSSGK